MYVSIQGYGTQIQDAGSGTHDVKGNPSIAKFATKYPITEQIVNSSKCHYLKKEKNNLQSLGSVIPLFANQK